MSTLKAPSQGRSHRRSPSDDRRQAAVLSPSAKGPLDEDTDLPSSTMLSPSRDRSKSPLPPRSPQSSMPGVDQIQQNIIGLICRPEIYRPLPPNMIPQPFLTSPNAPKGDATLDQLVQGGHFYAAAITSARRLSNIVGNADLRTVFDLFYTRLACLSLINKTCLEIAAVESLELRDLTAAMYLDPVTSEHLVPWHLRVLAVRLQSIGFKDWRRGVMSYYILAHDARQQIAKARSESDAGREDRWSTRLHDLGIRVANMLVEMGDLEAAGRHLRTLDTDGLSESMRRNITVMQVMVWLQIGDLRAAKRCLSTMFPPSSSTISSPALEAMKIDSSSISSDQEYPSHILHALTHMAEGNFSVACEEWNTILANLPNDEMAIQNRSICLLYVGQFNDAFSALETATTEMEEVPHHALLFNLCTFFELSTERSAMRKAGLVERLAESKQPRAEGWQRAAADFKMEGVGVRA